jgi:hypothetical protein
MPTLTTIQTQNQHLVLLHSILSLPRALRCLLRHLEIDMAMGLLDRNHPLGSDADTTSPLHGRNVLRPQNPA